MKVYICGRITGVPDYKERFRRAEMYLKLNGYEVVNPVTYCEMWCDDLNDYEDVMKHCLEALSECDAIAPMSAWSISRGMGIEIEYAQNNGIKIIDDLMTADLPNNDEVDEIADEHEKPEEIGHYIKIAKTYADAIIKDKKMWELRYNDRDYREGELLKFRVLDEDGSPMMHPIDEKTFQIEYIVDISRVRGMSDKKDWVVFTIKEVKNIPIYAVKVRNSFLHDYSEGKQGGYVLMRGLENAMKFTDPDEACRIAKELGGDYRETRFYTYETD